MFLVMLFVLLYPSSWFLCSACMVFSFFFSLFFYLYFNIGCASMVCISKNAKFWSQARIWPAYVLIVRVPVKSSFLHTFRVRFFSSTQAGKILNTSSWGWTFFERRASLCASSATFGVSRDRLGMRIIMIMTSPKQAKAPLAPKQCRGLHLSG